MKVLKILVSLTIIVISMGIYLLATVNMVEDFENKLEEDKCISSLISKGVERKDITRSNGTCIIETSNTSIL